jgi:enoyl-CoA hydratase/carnithine racemase
LDSDLLFEVSDGIGTVTFNRPDVLNALTLDVYARFRDLLAELRTDESVRVLVLKGSGRAFCSGGDVHEIIGALLDADMQAHIEFTRMTGAVVVNMRLLDKPIIAQIQGMAAGAGAVIALASDLRVGSETAKFAFLFTKVGLTGADMGAAYLLPRVVGMSRATELLMLGDSIDAATAERYGVLNRVVRGDEVDNAVNEWARRLADGPALALSMTKRMLNNEWNMDLISAIEAEAQAQALLMMGEDHRAFYEGFKKQQENRKAGEQKG